MDTSRSEPPEIADRLAGFRDTSRPDRSPFPQHGPSSKPAEEKPAQEDPGSSEEVISWDEIRDAYEEGDKQKARQETACQVLRDRNFLVPKKSNALWVWDPGAGVYREEGREVLEQLLADKLGAHHSTHEVRQVLAKVKALAPTGRLGETGVIPLESTDLLVDVYSTGEVSFCSREPDPERLIGARAQVPWRTGANRAALEEHLRQAVPSEQDRQVLQDYAGYSLLHWARPFRRALVLVGPEGSGAAPIMEVLSWLCGRVSSVRPSRLARGRSGTLPPQMWANICHEADPEALARLPLLSGLVLGDSPAEASSVEGVSSGAGSGGPRAAKYIHAKHIYSVSGLPPLAAGDDFFRRVLLVSCPETLGGRERGLKLRQDLWEERAGILQWALEGLRRVLRRAQAGEGFP